LYVSKNREPKTIHTSGVGPRFFKADFFSGDCLDVLIDRNCSTKCMDKKENESKETIQQQIRITLH